MELFKAEKDKWKMTRDLRKLIDISPLLTFYELRLINALRINVILLSALIHLTFVHKPKLDVEPVTEI